MSADADAGTESDGTRLTLVPPTGNPQDVQDVLDGVATPAGGPPPNLFLALARNPKLARSYLPFGGRLLFGGALPARHRELVILRTAHLCRCTYEWSHHVHFAARAGLSPSEIERVAQASRSGWPPLETTLLEATDQLVVDHSLERGTWDTLVEQYGEPTMVELTLLVGHYAMLAGFLNAADVAIDPTTGEDPSAS